MTTLLRAGLWCLLLWLPALQAADSGWITAPHNDHASVRLRSQELPGKPLQILLDIQLAPGWKTYWRAPGEGGVAPSIRWNSGVKDVAIHWPVPARFEVAGIVTQGYHGNTNLPITLTSTDSGPLSGTLTLSTCSNVCILTDYPFTLDRQTPPGPNFAFDFSKAMGAVPVAHALTDQITASYRAGEVTIEAFRPEGWQHPDAFFELPDGALPGEPIIKVAGERLTIQVPARDEWGDNAPDLTGKPMMLVLADGGIAQQVTLKPAAAIGSQPVSQPAWWQIALLALAGGFILNLMPCVLPVLGFKLGTLLQARERNRQEIRIEFLASSFGIVLAFTMLALLMTGLRLSGQALGWGIQFQNPWFIGLLVFISLLFSASLFGLYHFRLPVNLTTRMATHQSRGLSGHVVQGIFATLLATPCSAPFLGTAVAWALAASLPGLWAVFIALGIGMSLPWLLVAVRPEIALRLPKPGRWMLVMRTILGLMMLASCYWLLSLLTIFIGLKATVALGVLMAVTLLVAIFRSFGRAAALKATSAALLCAVLITVVLALRPDSASGLRQDNIAWQPLSEQAISQALAARKRVFIDVTADWCVTCKANKFNVILQPEVQKALSAPDVVALRGDWTRPSDAITAFLTSRGQAAVPFNQIYGPGQPDGVILSPLLNRKDLLTALENAKGVQP